MLGRLNSFWTPTWIQKSTQSGLRSVPRCIPFSRPFVNQFSMSFDTWPPPLTTQTNIDFLAAFAYFWANRPALPSQDQFGPQLGSQLGFSWDPEIDPNPSKSQSHRVSTCSSFFESIFGQFWFHLRPQVGPMLGPCWAQFWIPSRSWANLTRGGWPSPVASWRPKLPTWAYKAQ